jgi:hypothetical protein
MKTLQVAPSTINTIFGQLGDPAMFDEGYAHEGGVPNGQIVESNDFGGHSYTLKHFIYSAEVVRVDEKLEWKIISIKIIGEEYIKLVW